VDLSEEHDTSKQGKQKSFKHSKDNQHEHQRDRQYPFTSYNDTTQDPLTSLNQHNYNVQCTMMKRYRQSYLSETWEIFTLGKTKN
jgi:hypothetical protein